MKRPTSLGQLKPYYWRSRYAMWRPRDPRRTVRDGYTVLVPVPGDLPVLCDVALSVLARQDATHRVETLVIPDVLSPEVNRVVDSWEVRWKGALRVLDLALPERVLLPRLQDPGKNHPAQLLRGASATPASHVIFHDADLFPSDDDLHERAWAACCEPGIDVAGLEGPWDPWFAQRNRSLVATWEMCCRVDWLRRYAPWRHFAHEAEVNGQGHVFDTTFWPQWDTAQRRLRTLDVDGFIHFNYVISTYRKFQASSGPFRDEYFRLLLLRLLNDAFGSSKQPIDIPDLDELRAGLADPNRRVHYMAGDAEQFRTMSAKLRSILDGTWATKNTAGLLKRLAPFEQWADAQRS